MAISHAAETSSLTTFTGESNNRSQSLSSKNIRDDRYIKGHQYRGPLVWTYFSLKNNRVAEIRLPMRVWPNIYSTLPMAFFGSFHCLCYNYESGNLQRSQLFRSSKCVLCKCCCLFERIMEKMRLTK